MPWFFYRPPEPLIPVFATWDRFEPRARTDELGGALRAPVADPLWMLGRQHQFGEFLAEDAGSPVGVDVAYRDDVITHVTAGGVSTPLEDSPAEVVVEREAPNFEGDFRMRAQAGLELEQRLGEAFSEPDREAVLTAFRSRYMMVALAPDQLGTLDRATQQFVQSVAEFVLDGYRVFLDINVNALRISAPTILSIATSSVDLVEEVLTAWRDWFVALHGKPGSGTSRAWVNERLEYEFSLETAGPRRTTLVSPSYRSGDLDWPAVTVKKVGSHLEGWAPAMATVETLGVRPNFASPISPLRPPWRLGGKAPTPPPTGIVALGTLDRKKVLVEQATVEVPVELFSTRPTSVSFHGMPDPRFWAFESSRVDFGKLDLAKTDLTKLLLSEFALVFGDDWFEVPLPVRLGTVLRVETVTVTDVFGTNTEVPRLEVTDASGPEAFNLFGLSPSDDPRGSAVEGLIYISDRVPRDESRPLEEVHIVRDDGANLIWGVEKTLTNGIGSPMGGFAGACERRDLAKEASARAQMAEFQLARENLQKLLDELDSTSLNGATLEALQTQIAAQQALMAELADEIATGATGVAPPIVSEPLAPLVFSLGTKVPPNWIPYIPKRLTSSSAEIGLVQGEMHPDAVIGAEENIAPAEPRSRVLVGAPGGSSPLAYLREETVTRAGVKIQLTRQRARDKHGRVHTWLGRSVLLAGGEAASGLRFDVVVARESGGQWQ